MCGVNAPHRPFKCRFDVVYHIDMIEHKSLVYWHQRLIYHIRLKICMINMIEQDLSDNKRSHILPLN